MPGFDGTGPRGQGPMTGGARGFCALPAGYVRGRPFARRFFGRGGGRGFRNMYWATGMPGWMRAGYGVGPYDVQGLAPTEEMNILREEAQILKEQLEEIQGRISTLEKAQKQVENK